VSVEQRVGLMARLRIGDEIAGALATGRPVVALESTLISHGFPYPANRQIALESEQEIRAKGSVPATVAIRDGRLLVGLSADEIDEFATARGVAKAARPSLAVALAAGGWASTTVSATMIACAATGIRVFATGGIGGVHRGALIDPATGGRGSLDISSDLDELARTPVVVVCAGPKLILDVALTVEVLETRGVPVLTIGTDEVPGFWAVDSGVRSPHPIHSVEAAARVVATHLELGLGSGMLICTPIPAADAMPRSMLETEIEAAVAEAEHAGIDGAALTPWLLARLAERTNGATVRANLSLIRHNAAVAAELAGYLAATPAASR
jgi:pseudouridine-5'-phosphate glycosidase